MNQKDFILREETNRRIEKLLTILQESGQSWDAVFIISHVNQYYYTGTMQDGIFVLLPNGNHALFVRKSVIRAQDEAQVAVMPMVRYRDMANFIGSAKNIFIETGIVTVAIAERLKSAFGDINLLSVDNIISQQRAIKSPFELDLMRQSGIEHSAILNKFVPQILHEGMTEVDLSGAIFDAMLKRGHHGVTRFSMFQNETVLGQIGFGANAIYPAYFDGPGGMKGMSAAVPIVGDHNKKLKKGDLVFVDIAFGIDGYHTDSTQIYSFGAAPTDDILAAHKQCMEIQQRIARRLVPKAIPSQIYLEVTKDLDPVFLQNFMGIEPVKFLGHGIGLYVDEYPVIAKGFDKPLEEGMTLAIEPKKSIPSIGIVGVEDTYIVTPNGGECITFGEREIIKVKY